MSSSDGLVLSRYFAASRLLRSHFPRSSMLGRLGTPIEGGCCPEVPTDDSSVSAKYCFSILLALVSGFIAAFREDDVAAYEMFKRTIII